jgi:hypothetical protein
MIVKHRFTAISCHCSTVAKKKQKQMLASHTNAKNTFIYAAPFRRKRDTVTA